MTTLENTKSRASDDVEVLLRNAPPRAVPPIADERAVRTAVMAEWQAVVAKRRIRNQGFGLALAASVLVAVALQFGFWPVPATDAIEVAQVDRYAGRVHMIDGSADAVPIGETIAVTSGQTVRTSTNSAVGLVWHNGESLRVDENTVLEFIDAETVFLHHGRIYFDSQRAADDVQLVVQTGQGKVTHLGTQYMASIDGENLVVSVREGRVRIEGNYHDETAIEGKQVEMRGSARPVILTLASSSDDWKWTESLSPGLNLNDVSARDFLYWVGRETGYEIQFESDEAERLAAAAKLVGRVQADPRTELRLRMMTVDLDYLIDDNNGTISVRIASQGRQ